MKTKKEIYDDLEGFLSEKEFNPIKDKIRRYLFVYTGGVEFESFTVGIIYEDVEFIKFYIDKEKNIYRRVFFDRDGDIISIHHFVGDKCTTGICRKALDSINGYNESKLR